MCTRLFSFTSNPFGLFSPIVAVILRLWKCLPGEIKRISLLYLFPYMPRTRTFLITSYCTYRSHLHNITNPKTVQRSYWIQYQIEPKLISNFTDFNTFSLPTEPLFWTPHLSNTQNDFGAYLIILRINNLHHGTSTFYLFFSIATLAREHGKYEVRNQNFNLPIF